MAVASLSPACFRFGVLLAASLLCSQYVSASDEHGWIDSGFFTEYEETTCDTPVPVSGATLPTIAGPHADVSGDPYTCMSITDANGTVVSFKWECEIAHRFKVDSFAGSECIGSSSRLVDLQVGPCSQSYSASGPSYWSWTGGCPVYNGVDCARFASPVSAVSVSAARAGAPMTISGNWNWTGVETAMEVFVGFAGQSPSDLIAPGKLNADGSVTGPMPGSPTGTYPATGTPLQLFAVETRTSVTCESGEASAAPVTIQDPRLVPTSAAAEGLLVHQGGVYLGGTDSGRVAIEQAGEKDLLLVADEVYLAGELGGLKTLLGRILKRLDKIEDHLHL